MVIEGNPDSLYHADFESYGDHRIAMSFAVAALALNGTSTVHGAECVEISYPEFYGDLAKLTGVSSFNK